MLPGLLDGKMWIDETAVEQMEAPEPEPDPYVLTVLKVIERAMLDLETRGNTSAGEQEDAFWWLFVDERGPNDPFSLAWCCDYAGTTPREVRLRAEQRCPQRCWALARRFAMEQVGL